MVDIRSSTLTSSYTSGTLSVAKPSGMLVGDFLVVFLVAMGVHWGNAYWGSDDSPDFMWHEELGNPPPGTPVGPAGGLWPSPPVPPGDYPHHPPISTLANGIGAFDHVWTDTSTNGHFYSNYWSNLGLRDFGSGGMTDWDNAPSHAAVALWPFIDTWYGPSAADDRNPFADPCMVSITAVGRTVNGSEASSFSFTLNNPLDAEYDYRAVALCLTPNDFAGDFYDNIDGGGTDAKSFSTPQNGFFPATGLRQRGNVSTVRDSSGPTSAFSALDAYRPWDVWGIWPIAPYNYMWLADPTTPELAEPNHPADLSDADELVLNLIAYAAPTSFGNPAGITVADLSVSPAVDPLPLVHREIWTKGASTLMLHVSSTHPTPGHASDVDGNGIITLTQRILSAHGGPISAPYPPSLAEDPSITTEHGLGLALTFRVRTPYPVPPQVSIPSRLATIVG